MELKQGYKQTQLGLIPEEWEIRQLPQVAWFQEGPGLRDWQFTRKGMKVINVTNLENGVLNLDRTDRHISITEFNRMYQHFAIDANDIVMASSGNSYSKTSVVREQDLPLVMNTSVIRFKPSTSFDYGFLLAILNAPLFKKQIDLMITGGAQPNFGPYHLKRIHVPVPPLQEQRAIATALSDVDALLEGLDRLIAKKRHIKQAAMQQLLTGETRLPEFKGEWEVKQLSGICTMKSGDAITSDNIDGHSDFPCYGGNGLRGYTDRYTHDGLYVLIGRQGALCGNVQTVSGRFFASEHAVVVTPANETNILWLFFVLTRMNLNQFSESSAQPGLSVSKLMIMTCVVPPPPEQTAIATVLSDMDVEIEALELRRNKTKDIKQAMMQELLTGKTRLVTPGGSNA